MMYSLMLTYNDGSTSEHKYLTLEQATKFADDFQGYFPRAIAATVVYNGPKAA